MRIKTVTLTDGQLPDNLGAIGYAGDVNVTKLQITGADPQLSYKLDLRHETGVVNVLDLVNDDGMLSVIFDSAALIPSGHYRAQLRTVGDDVWHSNQAWLTIYASIHAEDFFDPVPTEMHQIEQRVTAAKEDAEDAQAAAEIAQTAAETARENAEAAQRAAETAAQTAAEDAAQETVAAAQALLRGYVSDAETAKTAAETARGEAEAAQTASETAQGKAESAQEKTEAAQTAAEDAQTAAETAQNKAEDAQTAAETAQGKTEDAQTAAEAAQTAAEIAQGLAETAQSKAEDAQTAANASASDALASAQTAQAWAEGKRGDAAVPSTDPAYHNNAKYWSEQAVQTLSSAQELLNDLNTHRYDAFAAETQSGERILHTDIGADGVPVKALSATVRATGSGTLTVRNYGVNLLRRTTPVPSIAVKKANGEYENFAGYRLYLSAGFYYLSVSLNRSGGQMNVVVVGADGTDKTLTNYYNQSNNHPSAFDLAGGVVWFARTAATASARKVKIDDGDALILFQSNAVAGGRTWWTYVDNLQVERGADVYPYPVTTPMQEYITPITATIDYDGDGTFDAAELPISRYGINNWMFNLPLPAGVISATLNVTYRCDPTLAYDKLKAAIVAAGTT